MHTMIMHQTLIMHDQITFPIAAVFAEAQQCRVSTPHVGSPHFPIPDPVTSSPRTKIWGRQTPQYSVLLRYIAISVDMNSPSEKQDKSRTGFYQCGVCRKHYARPDHLIRHVRSRKSIDPERGINGLVTEELIAIAPVRYLGQTVSDPFADSDLLRRHARGHFSGQRDSRLSTASAMRGRVSRACKNCALSKLKCDDQKPCRRCVKRNLECHWPQDERTPDAVDSQEPERSVAESSDSGEQVDDTGIPQSQEEPAPQDFSVGLMDDFYSAAEEVIDQAFLENNRLPLMSPNEYDYFGGNISPELGLTEADLEFLASLNNHDLAHERPNTVAQYHTQRSVPEALGLMDKEAYHNSPLSNWTPRSEDNAYMDQQYLSVPKHLDRSISSGTAEARVFSECLSKESRDKVFSIFVQVCQRRDFGRMMHYFPSAELLDSLIQDYFLHQRSEIDSWIHESTIDLNQESPEMIIALAAAGAVLSPVNAIQRLGYALLEIARLELSSKYENDNTYTRNLRQQQAYTLTLQIGLWSGDKRRVEIAESFAQPIVTMLRRASHLRSEGYPIISPSVVDDEETLNQKWHHWVESESHKRVVYHLFLHDVQSSFRLSTHALLSYGDLELPFPCSRKLWNAKSAAEWGYIYVQEFPHAVEAIPSLAGVLRDPSTLGLLPCQVDFPLAAFISVHGMSLMVADCNRTRHSLQRPWTGLLFQSWQRELEQELDQFNIAIVEPLHGSVPAVSLIHQAACLSLYLPLGKLERYAGKEGEKRSADVYELFIQHINPSHLRQAAWHAGQILRIARCIPPGLLTGFCATCLYFAALALWTYSTVTAPEESSGREVRTESALQHGTFLLDGEGSPGGALRRFVISGQGIPALSSGSGPAYLDNQAAVMRLFQQVLRSNYPSQAIPQQAQTLYHAFSALGSIRRVKEHEVPSKKLPPE
ncbi:C6 and C2H2 transcription factor [Aspergillus flavus]|uniref:C6 and C2H2 transcription factor n=1 Tax=Aspergillus flavus TaxID=5059 RepID=A0AB74CQM5_ASPFL|nr:C6 and C2H2 transcription factor [Aspergillus flavus]RMZ48412.1 C6 and C2H2 transcription factor [Aspergillus flavus]